MKKVILYMATSLDGFIASPDGSVDWLETDVDLGKEHSFESFLNQVDTIVMGRKSYVQTLSFGPWAFNQHRTYVVARSEIAPESPNTSVIHELTPEFIDQLKRESSSNIWLFGGGSLNHTFLENDWIDEIRLFVQPVALGSGIGLFGNKSVGLKAFNRKQALELGGGFTLLWYEKFR